MADITGQTGPINPNKSIEPTGVPPQGPKNFQSHMEGTLQPPTTEAAGPTPMSIAQQGPTVPSATPDVASILNQAKGTQDSLGTVAEQLKTPGLKLKRSQTHLLKNKLTNAQTYLKQSGAKLGVTPLPMKPSTGQGPIGKFMAYVNDGQAQLVQVQNKLRDLASKGTQLNPGEMLQVTVKMNLAQQEIEYSSTLLGKVIDSFKQMMNTQL